MPKIDHNTKLSFVTTTPAVAKIEDAIHFPLLDMTVSVALKGEDGNMHYVTTETARENGMSPDDVIHLALSQIYSAAPAEYTEWMPLMRHNKLIGMSVMNKFRQCPKRISISSTSAMLVEYKLGESSLPEVLSSMSTLRVLNRLGRVDGRSNIFILPFIEDDKQKILLIPDTKQFTTQIPVWYTSKQNKKASAYTVYYYMPSRNTYAVLRNPMERFWKQDSPEGPASTDLGYAYKMIRRKEDTEDGVSLSWIPVTPPKIQKSPA